MKNKRLRRLVRFASENPDFDLCEDLRILEFFLVDYIVSLRKEIMEAAENKAKLEERIESLEKSLRESARLTAERIESLEESLKESDRLTLGLS